MVKTAINLYSVRELDEPLLEVLDRVADAGYDGVQFSGGLGDADPADVVAKLEETGLEPTGAHVGIEELEDDLAGAHDLYAETLGCPSAVVPYLDESHFDSAVTVEETAARIAALAENAASEHEWPVHYHNHVHEFVEVDGTMAFNRFAELAPEVGIELDVGWALVGGEDPVGLIERYADRISMLHMKDMAVETEDFREIGEGDVDMQACADAAREATVEWLIYEHDEPENPTESIETGAAFLDGL